VLALIIYQGAISVKGHALKILKLKRSHCARTDYLSGTICVKGHALKLNLAIVQVKKAAHCHCAGIIETLPLCNFSRITNTNYQRQY
jgi:hypothetical protein